MALMEHNKTVFDDLTDVFEETRKVILVHGTGLGKSFLVMELLNTLFAGKKVLYVVPKNTITENMKEYKEFSSIDADVSFVTYNYFSTEEKAEMLADVYDAVICDEAHHLGSDLYGANTRILMDKMQRLGKYVLGLTATPIRDDKINVCDYFEKTVNGLTIFEAIQQGLVPSFEYLICSNDAEERTGYDRELSDFKQVVDYEMSLPALSEVIENNPKKRWLVFFPSIKAIHEQEDVIRQMFPDDYKILTITSQNDTSVKEILKYEKTVVLSVDKLLEGNHVPGTQGIILFRKVGSVSVFQQILGRVVHIGDTEHPLILDCTESAFKIFKKLLATEKEGKGGIPGVTSLKPILYCSLQNAEHYRIEKLLAEMDKKEFLKKKKEKNAKKALEKYYSFKGKTYDNIRSFSPVDKKKIEACAKLFHIEANDIINVMLNNAA